jgi:hypothetical protein
LIDNFEVKIHERDFDSHAERRKYELGEQLKYSDAPREWFFAGVPD